MNLVIDASNIRQGGGVTHLQEVLRVANLQAHGIQKITVWSAQSTLDRIGHLIAVDRKSHPLIEKGGVHAMWFRHRVLDQVVRPDTDLLWIPGGTYTGKCRPYVTMARNFLPFVKRERDRYKYSCIWFRYHFLRVAQKRTFSKAAGLIHVSQTTHDVINALVELPGTHQKVIHHGIHPKFFLQPRRQKDLNEFSQASPVRILYVSPIAHYKHQDKLIQAIARIRQKGISVIVDLVGAAEKAAKVKFDVIKQNLDPRGEWICWHGLVPYRELQDYYQRADMYVCLSSCETFGMILLEAMAAGLPVLCSNRSALPEINGGTCPAVDPENIEAVTAALENMIRDRELRERSGLAAYNRAHEFTWNRCADETFAFLRAVGLEKSKLE